MAKTYADLFSEVRQAVRFISLDELKSRLEQKSAKPFTLVDVREKDEYRAGYIPGAVHVPRSSLESQSDQKLHDKVRVEILGGRPVANVTYSYGIARSENFERRVTVKENLAPGKRVKRQKGSRGYDVTSVVNVLFTDGRVEQRTYYSGYRPAPEVFWVGPGYDARELPPLPDHCDGVEGQAETAQNASSRSDPFAEM